MASFVDSYPSRRLAQEASPLFSTIPTEIRATIFAFALTASDDSEKPYRADRKFYRPGYHAHQKIDCALLQTCRRVYDETRTLPVSLNEHSFWVFDGPFKSGGYKSRHTGRWGQWWTSLNEDQRAAVQRVHIFAQQYYLESLGARNELSDFTFDTKQLHLTFRHSDWWSWESPPSSSDKLGICPWRVSRSSCREMLQEPEQPDTEFLRQQMQRGTWGWQIRQMRRLQTLRIEFETDVLKKQQLHVVVQRAKHWRFPMLHDRAVLEWSGDLEETSWEGLKNLKDDYHFLRESPVASSPCRKYYVVTMVWRAVPEQ